MLLRTGRPHAVSGGRMTAATSVLLAAGLVIAGAACTSTSETHRPAPATSSTGVVTSSPPLPSSAISAAPPLPCTNATARPAGPGAGVTSRGTVWSVATNLDTPDDLLWADDVLLVGLHGSGRIEVLAAGGTPTTLPIRLSEIEGMVYIGSNLYLAGQAQDAVFEAMGGTQLRKVIQLNPVAGQPGIDGLSAQGGLLIVPDSARGVVEWVDPTSGAIEKGVGGFVRPTGAWPALDGSVLIADEDANVAVRLAPDRTRTDLARNLPIVDDVAEDSRGAVFAITAAASSGRLVQLANGSSRDLVSRLQGAQGLAIDGADNLYLTEAGAGRVDLLVRTFKLVPLRPVAPSAAQPICIDIQRAAGFDNAISLQAGPGVSVTQQPGTGSRGAVLLTDCPATPACQVTAVSGTWHDVLRLSP